MKPFIIGALLLVSTAALAQTATSAIPSAPIVAPTDQEIAEAHALCNKPDHFVGIGSIGNRPPDAGHYKPEWKRCEAIDAEHEKRDIAVKAKQQEDRQKVDAIVGRISK